MSEEITAPEAPETAQPEAPNTSLPQLEDVEEAMRDVVDPELGINVVDGYPHGACGQGFDGPVLWFVR